MYDLLDSPNFPAVIGSLVLLAAAGWQTVKWKIPNHLILVALVGAFAYAAVFRADAGGDLAPLMGTFLGGGLLLPVYARGYLGAGCVKVNAAFGAWIGCAVGVRHLVNAVFVTTIAGAACLFVAFAIHRLQHRSVEEGNRPTALNAQMPLSVGSLVGMVMWTMFCQ